MAEPQEPTPAQAAAHDQPMTEAANPEQSGPPQDSTLAIRPKRPGHGTLGKEIKVLTNWFKVDFGADEIYQYAVHINKIFIEREEPEGGSGRPPRRPREPRTPGLLPSLLCRAAMHALSQDCGWPKGTWAFDGRANMYTSDVKLISGDLLEREVETVMPGENKPTKFKIKVERVSTLPAQLLADYFAGRGEASGPHHVLQALDVALKHKMGMDMLLRPDIIVSSQGRSFLQYNRNHIMSLGGGAEVWMGYKQSVRPCQTGLALTIDSAAGAVWGVGDPENPRRLNELMNDILDGGRGGGRGGDRGGRGGGRGGDRDGRGGGGARGPLTPRDIRTLESALRGMKIQAVHNGFKRTIVGLARNTPFTERFDVDGRETTVAEYFQSKYNQRITDDRLPCIRIGNGKSLLPAEVCIVLPKQKLGKLSGDQTANMIRHAAQRPQEKMKFIENKVSDVGREARDELQTFKIDVSQKMMEVTGRVLPPPKLAYGGGKNNYDPGSIGLWNLKDIKFNDCKRLESWAVVSFARNRWEDEAVPAFVQEFIRVSRTVGVDCAPNPPIIRARPGAPVGSTMEQAARDAKQKFRRSDPKESGAQLILVILPDTGAELYRDVKQASDSALGIPSQCVVAQKAKIGAREARGQLQYIANVALKVNAKLGGRNVVLSNATIESAPSFLREMYSKPYIVFGADVTHPGVGSSMPSIAGVVASMDVTASRYASRIVALAKSEKRKSEEIIHSLKDIVKDLMKEFYVATRGKKPERIFFYRDGVSEGQFDQVVTYEYRAIREACLDLDSEYAPPITFIITGKRHQTRLFASDQRDADKSGNVKPGVVIDRSICHPREFDFYLNSHAGLQGSNRPCHYSVLVDENGFSADGIQELTYWMSYTFCRCNRSISVPSPVRYAHLAAFRGRTLISGGDSEAGSVASGDSRASEMLPVHAKLNRSMFYV